MDNWGHLCRMHKTAEKGCCREGCDDEQGSGRGQVSHYMKKANREGPKI